MTRLTYAESTGFTMTKSRITLPNYLKERLREEASDRGLSIKEMLEEDYGITEPDKVEPVLAEAMAIWEADLVELVKEHDAHN